MSDWNWDKFWGYFDLFGRTLDQTYHPARTVIKQAKTQWDLIDWDDPASFDHMYDDPFATIFGRPWLDWWRNKKIREDTRKYWYDYFENTGGTWDGQYPWKEFYDTIGSYNKGTSGDFFEASNSVVGLYGKWWKKW